MKQLKHSNTCPIAERGWWKLSSKSALGNAEFKDERDMDELYVSEARVDGGPMFKRIQTRARGMAYGILKRLAHIHVAVSSPDEGEAN